MTPNLTINITVSTPEAAAALLQGLGIQQQTTLPAAINPAIIPPAATTAPVPSAAYMTAAVPSAPANMAAPTQSTAPVSVTPAAPVQPPVGAAPAYTFEQVGKAGADLVASNPGLMPTLMGLLQRYGVQLVTDLKPGQLGTFAAELRALGAKI